MGFIPDFVIIYETNKNDFKIKVNLSSPGKLCIIK